ncbi:MAG TPA: family 20 glycosylhydrolase, partial [Niabella sp.]|nr:family 20 glycosylhydrolase [Niabella sp.]
VIMTPNSYAYFDHQQVAKDDSLTITNNEGGFLHIEKVYGWKLMPEKLGKEYQQYIQGGQANLWTEYITNPSKVEYMIFPRVAALCESLWSPQDKKDWDDFSRRLETQKKRYDLWGINYYGKQ